ncbi:Ca2+-dependent phosphoinositide-specific phospholipase C [Limibacter armeniacum]|uniref:Ca2+-dependent phosphoinositide-specific phospholipase C n=1 Tax=Limibacter armeniacum TaxID=466084 RepID=UPI002FE52831
MNKLLYAVAVASIAFTGVGCHPKTEQFTAEKGAKEVTLPTSTKLNEIQVLGTHNSYAKPIDPAVINMIDPIMEQMGTKFMKSMSEEMMARFKENHPNPMSFSEGLAYDHPDFVEQLDSGLRSFEIDVYYDPTGNRFHKPATYELLKQRGINELAPFDSVGLTKPGFKVLHVADIDFRTHYTTFRSALEELKGWSDAHADHIPIFIMIEAKDMGIPLFPNSTEVLSFDNKAFMELDAEIISILGRDKVITPDDVRGNYKTLEEAVLAQSWPSLKSSLGKFVFMLLPSGAGTTDVDKTPYLQGRPSLEDRVMFVRSEPGYPHAAFLLMDNAIVRKEEITEAVKKGYLVRTRSDIETYEAKVNDHSRKEAAFESGAQVVSTDFFKSGNVYNTDYVVRMPNGKAARVSPAVTKELTASAQ